MFRNAKPNPTILGLLRISIGLWPSEATLRPNTPCRESLHDLRATQQSGGRFNHGGGSDGLTEISPHGRNARLLPPRRSDAHSEQSFISPFFLSKTPWVANTKTDRQSR